MMITVLMIKRLSCDSKAEILLNMLYTPRPPKKYQLYCLQKIAALKTLHQGEKAHCRLISGAVLLPVVLHGVSSATEQENGN